MKVKIFLLITNIFTFLLLTGIIFHYHLDAKLIRKIFKHDYLNNREYLEQITLYEAYAGKATIVMLGNSITAAADWNELLNRNDIANRGISGDITAGFINRMEYVYKADPEICFVMGGINDIIQNVPVEDIKQNLKKIAIELNKNNITPVIQSILFVNAAFSDHKVINSRVAKINKEMEIFCKANGFDYLNINDVLSEEGNLIAEYTFDGLHLNGKAYMLWKQKLIPVLGKYGISQK